MPRPTLRPLAPCDREQALERLVPNARENLLLLELVAQLGHPPPEGEGAAELIGLWTAGELTAVASLRPTMIVEADLDPAVLGGLLPALRRVGAGLVKSPAPSADPLWRKLRAAGRRAYLDRVEIGFSVDADAFAPAPLGSGGRLRRARPADLGELVEAARASLREEGRPDPFKGDRDGFRRWVRGRLDRATLIEVEGQLGFVGYADVRRPEGWLLQGVYTRPGVRRRGLAAAGVSALCSQAFAAGADHAQLSVVEGNAAAEALYGKLGFRPFGRLRTILFG